MLGWRCRFCSSCKRHMILREVYKFKQFLPQTKPPIHCHSASTRSVGSFFYCDISRLATGQAHCWERTKWGSWISSRFRWWLFLPCWQAGIGGHPYFWDDPGLVSKNLSHGGWKPPNMHELLVGLYQISCGTGETGEPKSGICPMQLIPGGVNGSSMTCWAIVFRLVVWKNVVT